MTMENSMPTDDSQVTPEEARADFDRSEQERRDATLAELAELEKARKKKKSVT